MKTSILVAAASAVAFSIATIAPVQAGVVGPMSSTAKAEMGTSLIEEVGRRGRRSHRRRGRRGRGLAIGAGIVTLGIIGALAASRRANSRDYYEERHYQPRHRYHYRNQCRRWLNRCRRGNDRACWRYDTRC